MDDLLCFKQRELAKEGALSERLEDVRRYLSDFYLDYEGRSFNLPGAVYYLKYLVAECDLPVPSDLLDLLEQSERPAAAYEVCTLKRRDHMLHSLNLFSLGALLITRFSCVADVLDSCALEEKLKRWAFCSLLHDTGYIETTGEPLREQLIRAFRECARTVEFQLKCVLGHKHPLTRDQNREMSEKDPHLRAITAPARTLLEQKLAFYPAQSAFGATVLLGGAHGRYFSGEHTDHGIASAVLLSLCRGISTAILSKQDNFRLHGLPGPVRDLWAGLENPLNAIAFHDKRRGSISPYMALVNPWMSFLRLMDSLAEYDRPALNSSHGRQVTHIKDIGFEENGDFPIFHFPRGSFGQADVEELPAIAAEHGLVISWQHDGQ